MPEFFPFIPGSETNSASSFKGADSTSPLLGRFRAVPPRNHTPNIFSDTFPPRWQPPSRLSSNRSGFGGGGGGGGGGGRGNTGGGFDRRRLSSLSAAASRGSVHVGYGALVAAGLDNDDDEDDEEWSSDDDNDDDDGGQGGNRTHHKMARIWRRSVRKTRRNVEDLWVAPRHGAVRRVVETWWSRWGVLVFLPAFLAIAWCAIPFPLYPLDDADASGSSWHGIPIYDKLLPPRAGNATHPPNPASPDHRSPGHGEARVQVNFWFFLFVYYGFYNLTALMWITKVFNLYSLNWWPSMLGFPLTISLIAIISLAAPIPVYLIPEARWLTVHNTAWISWTFIIMAMPVGIAFCILMTHERHLGLRHSLSETQRIFTSSWWTGEGGGSVRDPAHNRRGQRWGLGPGAFDPDAGLQITAGHPPPAFMQRRRWLPASFVRFIWFCLALIISLLAYLIGEAYAEIYLRTLPHNSWETIVYVYSWVLTVHLLDLLTGWVLGGNEGERVGSYPLSWIFKLYFMLTYQTYVRALYARLRSPQQFIALQVLSSGFLIILTPITMTQTYHRALTMLGLTNQSYGSYQKICTRNVFIKFLAENVSMLTFLGSILVLHFGPNTDVYPYFAFDDPDEPYNFNFTIVASAITWACELVAGFVLRGLIRWIFDVNANIEGRMDLAVWPELLPTSVAVMLHVLQNMLFSIVRLHFR